MKTESERVHVVDSHTGGEPTRVVISGGPDLGSGPLTDRLAKFRSEHDAWRSALVNEPRGSDVIIGALLCEPTDASCKKPTGVIFFNNVGYLGMCGHGTIGVIDTLAWLRRIKPGMHRVETPVGIVDAELHPSGEVTVRNRSSEVIATRHCRKMAPVQIEDIRFSYRRCRLGRELVLHNGHAQI